MKTTMSVQRWIRLAGLILAVVTICSCQMAQMPIGPFGASKRSGDWGRVAVGLDENDRWWAELENSVMYCRYGFKPINPDVNQGGVGVITHLTLKSTDQNQIGAAEATGRIDGCAGRFMLVDAVVVHDGPDRKTVRLKWGHRKGKDKIQEVTIYPGQTFIRIDYIDYGVNVVDIVARDGGENRVYWFYGGDKWKRDYLLYPKSYYYPPGLDAEEITGMPGDDGPGPLEYRGHFIMALYDEKTGLGYGRVAPVSAIRVIKLLHKRGFELFPYFHQEHRPYTGYVFLFSQGAEEANRVGRRIVDEVAQAATD